MRDAKYWSGRWRGVAARSAVALTLLFAPVTSAGCALRATHGDYESYRAYRLAEDSQQRALAGALYLERHPRGTFADEVRAALSLEEERFYAARATSAQGLRDYLRVYPDGRYADAVRAELAGLSWREAEDVAAGERAREASEAAAAETLRAHRAFTRDQLDLFLGVLLRLRSWDLPMEQVVQDHPGFDRAFAHEPRPVCDATQCTKVLRVNFALPIADGAVVARVSEVRVVLRLEQERLLGAEVWLPGYGFSRWSELENRAPVNDDDAEARREAVRWAMAQLAPLLEAALGDSFQASARAPLPSPVGHSPLLSLDADGVSVDVVVAAEGGDGLDGLVIGPRAAVR
jgi:hypothetical protein